MSPFIVFLCVGTLTIALAFTQGAGAGLQAQGCDQGWTDYRGCCYIALVGEVVSGTAKSTCESFGASLLSIWSDGEMNFTTFLLKAHFGYTWTGLRGSDSNVWVYDDQSAVRTIDGEWSILDFIPRIPADISRKCVALGIRSVVAILDCHTSASAFVCKKALPKVYITPKLLNRTDPDLFSPLNHVQLFERHYPPAMTSLPDVSSLMIDCVVTTEMSCAFKCLR